MSAKRDKFTKGRRSKPIGEGKLMRRRKTAHKVGRKTRKQRDIKLGGPAGHRKRSVRKKSR